MLILDQLKRNDPPLRVLTLVMMIGFVVLLSGLWWVQVVSSRYYEAKLETQTFRSVRTPANRGKLLDRNGAILAENRSSYGVSLYLEELSQEFRSEFARDLRTFNEQNRRRPDPKERSALGRRARSEVTSNAVFQVSARLQRPFVFDDAKFTKHCEQNLAMPYPVVSNLDAVQIARFCEQTDLPRGLDLENQPTRIYPNQSTLAHLLGYVRKDDSSAEGEEAFFNHRLPDFAGSAGAEAAFDRELRGRAGAKSVIVNNLGYRQSETVWTGAEPGHNVTLTIDLSIQRAAERALERLGPSGANTRGAVVVMDVRDGDLLAVVSSPTFNPNQFVQGRFTSNEWARLNHGTNRPQINRAAQENYAPGSIFKTVVGLAALDAGLDPAQKFTVEPDPKRPGRGCIFVGNRKIEDQAPPGEYDFKRAIKMSSNAYFITNGLRAGIVKIVQLGQRLHLGERTGLPTTRQEVGGVFPSLERVTSRWFDGNTANVCIGQDPVLVTPLQMAVLTAALANGGHVLRPRLVDRIEPAEGARTGEPVVFERGFIRNDLGVKSDSLRVLREAMLADVEDTDGTGHRSVVDGLRICGKTGTAQVKNERGVTTDHTTWFISYAPYENPHYAVVVMVESGGSGGDSCAPIAGEIYRAIQQRDRTPKPATIATAK